MKKEVILRWVPDPDDGSIPSVQKSMEDVRLSERKIYVIGRGVSDAHVVIPTNDETISISHRNTVVYVKNGTAYVGNLSTHGSVGTFINDEQLTTVASYHNNVPEMEQGKDPGKNWIAVTGDDLITIGGKSKVMYFKLEGSEPAVKVTRGNYHKASLNISADCFEKYPDSGVMKGTGNAAGIAKCQKISRKLAKDQAIVTLDDSIIRQDSFVTNLMQKSYLGPLPVIYDGDPEDEEELELIGRRDIRKYKTDLGYQSTYLNDYTKEELLEWKGLTAADIPVNVPGIRKNPLIKEAGNSGPGVKDYNCSFSYTKLKTIGEGGFATVYLIRDDRDNEKLALKELDKNERLSPYIIETTLREAEIGIGMNHENLVKYHAIRKAKYYQLFMEYCDGGSVKDLMKENGGRLDIEEATGYILQVLDALDYMHNCTVTVKNKDGIPEQRKGLVHRDVKPDNMLIKDVDGKIAVKLSDFGFAKSTESSGLSGITTTEIAGSLDYVSKRQFSGFFKDAGYPEDVFSAAASYYAMLTGRSVRPFRKSKRKEDYILKGIRTPILEANPHIPAGLAQVIDSVLSEEDRKTADTFTTAAEFKEMIINALGL